MPRYDPDVIAALAEGRLDPEEAATLEREITADPVAAAELTAHRIALGAVSGAPRPELSTSERSDLHAAVAAALGITAPEPAASQRARRVPWGSLGIAAAALAGLVAVVPLVGLLSTAGGDDATASLELAAEAPTTAVAAEPEARTAPADEIEALVTEADVDDALKAGESAGTDAATFGSSTTLPHAATTTIAAAASSTTTSGAAPEGRDGVEQLAAELETIKSDPAAVNERATGALEESSCWAEDTEIRADPPPQRYVFEYENGELTVIVYFELDAGELGPFQVWGVPDCMNLVVIP